MLRALACLAAATVAAAPAPPQTEPTSYYVNLGLVREIVCVTGDGTVSGTGSYIDGNTILTAWHVVAHGACAVDGQIVTPVYHDAGLDVAVVSTPAKSTERMPISCAIPREGEEYLAAGFPLGEAFAMQRFTATGNIHHGAPFDGMAVFRGHAFPGMSGSAVIDRDGNVVAILNAANARGSMLGRLLRDTYLCRGRKS